MNKKLGDSNALSQRQSMKETLRDQRSILLILIIGIAVLTGLANSNFFAMNNVLSIFQQISVTGILTMAMAMQLLNGGLDLSMGNVMVLAGCVISMLLTGGSQYASDITGNGSLGANAVVSLPVAVIIGFGVAIGAGLLNGWIVAKSKCMPLIITLGMSNVYYGLALLLTGGQYLSFNLQFEPLRLLQIANVIPITLIIFIGMVIIAWMLINRTKYGRRAVAIGGNEENARLSGIKVDKYKIITYGIGGLYYGVAAILYASRLDSVTAGGGANYALTALTGAIIGGITFDGGKGTIFGAFLGVLFMGLIANAMNILNIDSYLQISISGIIVVIAVVISNLDNLRRK